MIFINNLSVHHSGIPLFEGVTFLINPRERIGLVGKNGAGKSTILKILAGVVQQDGGSISFPKEFTTGYLSQELNFLGTRSVIEEAASAFKEIKEKEKHYEELTSQISTHPDSSSKDYLDLLNDWHDAGHHLEILGINTLEEQMEKILLGLGFARKDFSRSVSEFSGGWQMRIELAKLLLQKPDLLLLDEPTNHLDIEAIIWLEEFLQDYAGAVVLVSHDRAFLDRVTSRTIEIANHTIEDYPCSYSRYVTLRKERREHLLSQKKNQDNQIRQTEVLIEKFRYKASKAKFAQSLIKQLDRTERIDVEDEDNSSIRFKFPEAERSGQLVFEAKQVSKYYGNKEILSNVNFQIIRGDRVAFVGKNGEGKTTMLKMIVGEEPQTSGEITPGYNAKIGFYAQHQADRLSGEETVFNTIDRIAPYEMSTKVRGLLGAFLFRGDDVDKKVKVLSGGEKSRLALAKLLLEPVNILILDEPTNHLDMRSKDVLKEALINYHGTLILVSHDRDFLDGLVNKIYYFSNHVITEHLGGVYEFLQSQKAETFRDIELSKGLRAEKKLIAADEKKKMASAPKEVNQKDLKKMERQVRESEKKIAALEDSISHIELRLSKPETLSQNDSTEIFEHYEKHKLQLKEEMEKWEKLTEQFELSK
ncbi:MAG: ribosomal protection-like ABC-F family protein [Chitinophagales bacterium]